MLKESPHITTLALAPYAKTKVVHLTVGASTRCHGHFKYAFLAPITLIVDLVLALN